MPLWRVSDLLPWHSLIAAQTRRKRGLGDQLRKNQLGLVFWAIPAEESGRKRKKAEESGRKYPLPRVKESIGRMRTVGTAFFRAWAEVERGTDRAGAAGKTLCRP